MNNDNHTGVINNIIDGIARKLYQTFGDGYTIYNEKIPQGFQEPCFAILHLLSSNETNTPYMLRTGEVKVPSWYLRRNAFDIHFFPTPGQDEKSEMYRIAECLLLALEYIYVSEKELDILVRGTKMRYEIVDDVLHFFISYDLFVKPIRDEEGVYMDELNSNHTVEG